MMLLQVVADTTVGGVAGGTAGAVIVLGNAVIRAWERNNAKQTQAEANIAAKLDALVASVNNLSNHITMGAPWTRTEKHNR